MQRCSSTTRRHKGTRGSPHSRWREAAPTAEVMPAGGALLRCTTSSHSKGQSPVLSRWRETAPAAVTFADIPRPSSCTMRRCTTCCRIDKRRALIAERERREIPPTPGLRPGLARAAPPPLSSSRRPGRSPLPLSENSAGPLTPPRPRAPSTAAPPIDRAKPTGLCIPPDHDWAAWAVVAHRARPPSTPFQAGPAHRAARPPAPLRRRSRRTPPLQAGALLHRHLPGGA